MTEFLRFARRNMRPHSLLVVAVALAPIAACVPRVTLPQPPFVARGVLAADAPEVRLARDLAPVLFVQRDEPFPLLRVAAVVHPTRPIIAYHLLWKHDVNGQWLPWAKPSDEEEVWVGYDSLTHAPTDMWTYWHGSILHTDWRDRGVPAVSVQWGKHGSLPHGVIESDLPATKTLNFFYAAEFFMLPDIWLGKLGHGGPWGFFHSYGRYRDFSDTVQTRDHLVAVIHAEDPREALHAVFGTRYSNKTHWPWDVK